jgi:hypothetical protein
MRGVVLYKREESESEKMSAALENVPIVGPHQPGRRNNALDRSALHATPIPSPYNANLRHKARPILLRAPTVLAGNGIYAAGRFGTCNDRRQ